MSSYSKEEQRNMEASLAKASKSRKQRRYQKKLDKARARREQQIAAYKEPVIFVTPDIIKSNNKSKAK